MINDESLASLFKSSTKVFGKSTAEVTLRKKSLLGVIFFFFLFCNCLLINKIEERAELILGVRKVVSSNSSFSLKNLTHNFFKYQNSL